MTENKNITITPLPDEFTGGGAVSGFTFKKVKESETAYIYRVSSGVGKSHFEVFLKRIASRCIDFQNKIYSETEFKEVYPNTEDFGRNAWTTWNFKEALDRFESLVDAITTKK